MKKYTLMVLNLVLFYAIAISFWLLFHQVFYLYNFIIIGTSLGLSLGLWPLLPRDKKHIARKLGQALVGGYMFLGLGTGLVSLGFGVIQPENMQIEGFWFLLLGGVFAASVMHYTIAKLTGPFIYNRAWCSWACWTAGVLDVLPWKKSPGRARRGWGLIRYAVFAASLALVLLLVFAFGFTERSIGGIVNLTGRMTPARVYENLFLIPEFWWFAGGNLLYYLTGIILAAVLKDNRAFCKYVCPVTVFLKIGARFSLLRIRAREGCTRCGKCESACPMDVGIMDYVERGTRVKSTECIMCMSCINACPKRILSTSFACDVAGREFLRRRAG